jgi:hypothetical protein
LTRDDVFYKAMLNGVKIPMFMVGVFLTLSATSEAAPHGGGFSGGGFHGGFGARSAGPVGARGGGGFLARNAGAAFRMGHGMHSGFGNRRFFRHNNGFFFGQFAWPVYWYPPYYDYYDPLAYSYLEPDNDYQYWDNSAPPAQPESFRPNVDHGPVVVVINTGNSRPTNSGSNAGYVDRGYIPVSAGAQQRIVAQDPSEKTGSRADPMPQAAPAVPQATPAPTTQVALQPGPGVFGKFVLVSWLDNGGKDVIFVKNIETNDVQRITSQPNIDNLRIVEIHPNADPGQFEAIISNGSEQGPVRFRF